MDAFEQPLPGTWVLSDTWKLSAEGLSVREGETMEVSLQPWYAPSHALEVQVAPVAPLLVNISPRSLLWQPEEQHEQSFRVVAMHDGHPAVSRKTSIQLTLLENPPRMVSMPVHVVDIDGCDEVNSPWGSSCRCPDSDALVNNDAVLDGGCMPCDGQSCPQCPAGHAFDFLEYPTCRVCPPGKFRHPLVSLSCDVCPNGTYQDAFGSTDCKDCSATTGMACHADESGLLIGAAAAKGWWKFEGGQMSRCVGTACEGANTCASLHTGVLCGSCIPGATRNSADAWCQQCGSTGFIIMCSLCVTLLISLHIMNLTRKAVRSGTQIKNVDSMILKTLLGYLALSSVAFRLMELPQSDVVRGVLSFFELSTEPGSSVFSIKCFFGGDPFEPYTYLLLGWAAPFMAVLFAIGYGEVASRYRRLALLETRRDNAIGTLIVALHTVHPTVTSYLLGILSCEVMGEELRWRINTDVVCFEGLHRPMAILAILGVIVFTIGIPLSFFFVLRSLYRRKRLLHSVEDRKLFGFLYNGFETEFYFWEIFLMMRKVFALLILFLPGIRPLVRSIVALLFGRLCSSLQHTCLPYDNRNNMIVDSIESASLEAFTTTLMGGIFLRFLPEVRALHKDIWVVVVAVAVASSHARCWWLALRALVGDHARRMASPLISRAPSSLSYIVSGNVDSKVRFDMSSKTLDISMLRKAERRHLALMLGDMLQQLVLHHGTDDFPLKAFGDLFSVAFATIHVRRDISQKYKSHSSPNDDQVTRVMKAAGLLKNFTYTNLSKDEQSAYLEQVRAAAREVPQYVSCDLHGLQTEFLHASGWDQTDAANAIRDELEKRLAPSSRNRNESQSSLRTFEFTPTAQSGCVRVDESNSNIVCVEALGNMRIPAANEEGEVSAGVPCDCSSPPQDPNPPSEKMEPSRDPEPASEPDVRVSSLARARQEREDSLARESTAREATEKAALRVAELKHRLEYLQASSKTAQETKNRLEVAVSEAATRAAGAERALLAMAQHCAVVPRDAAVTSEMVLRSRMAYLHRELVADEAEDRNQNP